jgi:probable rRNA maturation factor
MGGLDGPPICSSKQVILLAQEADGVRGRALSLFAGRAKRALGLRGEVCVLITSDREMRELNRRHRHKDEPTDVLSFPSGGPKQAGDIAISGKIAATNASALGHSLETELKVLILHGLLHLAGHDHERDNGEMEACELALRQEFKLPVGLIERTHGAARAPRSSLRLARPAQSPPRPKRRRKAAR